MAHTSHSNIALKIGRSALLVAALVGTGTLAHASGSYGGGYSSSPSSSSYNNSAKAQERYNLGKRIYRTKLTCDTCPMADVAQDRAGAKHVVKQLKKDKDLKEALSKRERKAVAAYLKKRYKL